MCDVTPVGRNNVMFAHYVVRRNITYTLPKASSLARKGKHRSADLLYRRSPFGSPFEFNGVYLGDDSG